MLKTLLFVFFVAILLPVEPAYSQDKSQYSQDNFRKAFIRGLRDEDIIRAKTVPIRLGREKTELVIQNYLLLVNDDDVANRVFDEFVATGLLRKYQKNLKASFKVRRPLFERGLSTRRTMLKTLMYGSMPNECSFEAQSRIPIRTPFGN